MIEATITIREARDADRQAIADLLTATGLGADGVLTAGSRYWLAEDGESLAAVVGIEQGAGAALLRSAAVRPAYRGRHLGSALIERAISEARAAGSQRIYLFSTGAGPYWQRLGFYEVPVAELADALPETFQVRHYARLGWLPAEVAWCRGC